MSPALPREERVSTVSLRAIALSDPQDTAKTGALALMARLAADELDATRLALAVAETENERLRRVTHDIDQELGIFEHQRNAARAEVAALRGRIEAHLATCAGWSGHDADLRALAADEGERTGRCVVCRRQLTEDDIYWHHARLGVDVCDTCPKTNVCGEDITHHAMLWHVPNGADDE